MKTIILPRQELLRKAADEICAVFREKPDAAVTMAAGRTMLPLWELLGETVREGKLSMKEARFFQTAEFLDAPAACSLQEMTEQHLLACTDLDPEHCFWLSDYADCPEDYDAALQNAGGLDLAVLGLGDNAHIGLNEPPVPFDTRTGIRKLTKDTRNQYAWLFGSAEKAPEKACTMGIRTLTEAKKIMVLCLGEKKAQATFSMLYARTDGLVPAAYLQLPYDVTVYADPEAAEKL